uniref:Reverse transcriptase domain-containing protein n=1 Tax=Nippostrongylus brasiliensis TaxID=27835 RepID=A0A0N4YLD3_NIPBR
LCYFKDTTEETVSARTELVSSISSQVADGIGSIISQLVDKKLQEERKGVSAQVQPAVLSLKHPGLQAQASLLSKSITQVEDIEVENDSEEKLRKLGEVKKNLKRRLTTVVGADTDSSIFALADNFDKFAEFVDHSIEELLEIGTIETIENKPAVVSPLAVAQGKKLRLILDLSWLNKYVGQFLRVQSSPVRLLFSPVHLHRDFQTLLARWRALGVSICLYPDDGLIGSESEQDQLRAVKLVCEDLKQAGVTLALEKSQLHPQSTGVWLGFGIELLKRQVSVASDRIGKAVRWLHSMRCSKAPTLRERLKFVGTVNSMCFEGHGRTLDRHVPLSECEQFELEFWDSPFEEGKDIIPSVVIASDASDRGLGAVLHTKQDHLRISTNIPPTLELLAVLFALKTWKLALSARCVELKVDNQATASIVRWLPRSENWEADLVSRILDYDDWGIQVRSAI